MAPRPLELLVLPHTHWDREWYHPAERFRQRLVALVDARLAGEAGAPVLLDGQAIPLEDYLAVRPGAASALAAALRAGRLEAGPWYVLADLLIPRAESAIRNLLTGARVLQALGASAPPVFYAPDAFGHPAWGPTVGAGFGFALAIAWRGYGGPEWPPGDAAWWIGPDGSRILLHHLPPDGYEFGSALPADAAGAERRAATIDATLRPRATLGVTLLTVGADHHAIPPALPAALDALATALHPHGWRVRTLGLTDAAQALVAAAGGGAAVPTIAGELRHSPRYTWALQGTFATRTAQKRRHQRLERRLIDDVEPQVAHAWARAGAARDRTRPDAQLGPAQLPALLDATWATLLACQPHDTLCGCSIDQVAVAADGRLEAVEAQLDGLAEAARDLLLGRELAAVRDARAQWQPALVWSNPLPWRRGGPALVRLVRWLADEPVGPGSAARGEEMTDAHLPPVPEALAAAGPVQFIRRCVARERIESPQHYPDNDRVLIDELLVAGAPVVPASGCLVTRDDSGPDIPPPRVEGPTPPPLPPPVAVEETAGGITVTGGGLTLRVDDGGITVRDEVTGHAWTHLLSLVDQHDAGDCYTPSPRGRGSRGVLGSPRIEARGPWRATVRVPVHVAQPRGARGALDVALDLSLEAGRRALRVDVHGVNARRDHRLRLLVALREPHDHVRAEDGLGVVARRPALRPPAGALERPAGLAPVHRWVHAGRDGLLCVADGLPEVELLADRDRRSALAFTVLRAVGELSRATLPERPGHAGWPVPTPRAQEVGPFAATLWLVAGLPAGPDGDALADRIALELLHPLTATTLRAAVALPPAVAGVALEGDALAPLACKPSADGRALVLRCVNRTDAPAPGGWTVPLSWQAAWRSRLDETPLIPLERDGDHVRFVAGPREVVTIRFELPAPSAGG